MFASASSLVIKASSVTRACGYFPKYTLLPALMTSPENTAVSSISRSNVISESSSTPPYFQPKNSASALVDVYFVRSTVSPSSTVTLSTALPLVSNDRVYVLLPELDELSGEDVVCEDEPHVVDELPVVDELSSPPHAAKPSEKLAPIASVSRKIRLFFMILPPCLAVSDCITRKYPYADYFFIII